MDRGHGDIAPRTGIDGPIELDIYGGYKFTAGPIGVDLGALRYQYVGNNLQHAGGGELFKNANTTELYAAGTWGQRR